MAARFPQSATSVAYRIKAEWADKIHAIWWAAGADSAHALRSGENATTVITRSSSGATFDTENGVIVGDINSYFTDTESGGFGGLAQDGPWTLVSGWWGDLFYGIGSSNHRYGITTGGPSSTFASIRVFGYEAAWTVAGGGGESVGADVSNQVDDWITIAARHDPEDAVAAMRAWLNGAELTDDRNASVSPTSSDPFASVWVGGSGYRDSGGNIGEASWEFAMICDALSDADMATITANPAVIVEIVEADTTPPTLTSPTATATGQTTASGSVTTDEGNGTLYYLASANSTESAATVKGGGSQAVTGTGVQNVSFTSLTAETSYYPHYVHVDAADNESNVASGSQFTTDAPPPPPDAPTIGAVSNLTHNSVTINWTDNSDNETGFKVEYGVSSGGTVASWSAAPGSPAAANATSLGLAGLTPEETYKGRVAATNASGDSSWVETAEFTTEAAPAVGTKGVIIDLGAGAANESGIYVRYQDDDTGGSEPDYTDESASADAQGRIVLNLASVTALNMGDEGFVLAFKQGADRTDDLIAGGRVPIVDISE